MLALLVLPSTGVFRTSLFYLHIATLHWWYTKSFFGEILKPSLHKHYLLNFIDYGAIIYGMSHGPWHMTFN
jgi:hypothetical protein